MERQRVSSFQSFVVVVAGLTQEVKDRWLVQTNYCFSFARNHWAPHLSNRESLWRGVYSTLVVIAFMDKSLTFLKHQDFYLLNTKLLFLATAKVCTSVSDPGLQPLSGKEDAFLFILPSEKLDKK